MPEGDDRISRQLEFDEASFARELFGPHNRNLDRIARLSGVSLDTRGVHLTLSAAEGPDTADRLERTARLVYNLYKLVERGRPLTYVDIDQGWRIVSQDEPAQLAEAVYEDEPLLVGRRKIYPKTANQTDYLEAIRSHDIVFGIGPAGTGKTYLAVAMAVQFLLERRVKRLILTRPAVEAGEKLGFLPGDMAEKVNPYLRPLYDALNDMLEPGKVLQMREDDRMEVAPLAFMRGRTLNNAFIILDEAQNTTPEQMKMFLTRLGNHSKAVVTGDVTQIDLPGGRRSGLIHAREVLDGIEGIRFITFQKQDVIRHKLVERIVYAYERHEEIDTDRPDQTDRA